VAPEPAGTPVSIAGSAVLADERRKTMSLLCLLGFHQKRSHQTFYPSINAEIVTEYRIYVECIRCGEVFSEEKFIWDGNDFVQLFNKP
jgi:hypothetical protein